MPFPSSLVFFTPCQAFEAARIELLVGTTELVAAFIDLRETAAGRVAYLKGTRLTVHWVIEMNRAGGSAEQFARDAELSLPRVRAAFAYFEAFPKEIEADLEHAAANRHWIQQQDAP